MVLAPEPQAHFVVGHMRAHIDPPALTVAVNVHGTTHACFIGGSPGLVVLARPEAPRVHLLAVDGWPGEVVELHGPHGRHHGEIVVGEPGVVVAPPSVVVETPGVVVGAPGVVVGAPGVVVGAPGVVVGAPGVVVGGPSVVVGAPGVVVGAGVEVHGGGRGHGHDHGR